MSGAYTRADCTCKPATLVRLLRRRARRTARAATARRWPVQQALQTARGERHRMDGQVVQVQLSRPISVSASHAGSSSSSRLRQAVAPRQT